MHHRFFIILLGVIALLNGQAFAVNTPTHAQQSRKATVVRAFSIDPLLDSSLDLNELTTLDDTRIELEKVNIEPGFADKFVEWESVAQVYKAFELIKNERFLEHDSKKRRMNWLEPNDRLCFGRAGMASGLITLSGYPVTTNVYLSGGTGGGKFGGGAFTSCSAWRDGSGEFHGADCIKWPWHSAAAVKVGPEIYVLDPALQYDRPVTLKEWVALSHEPGQGTNMRLQVGMTSFGKHPGFGDHFGYDDAKMTKREVFDAFVGGYKKDAWGRSPLETEQMKVTKHHSTKLLFNNPPWIGRSKQEESTWTRYELDQAAEKISIKGNCRTDADNVIVDLIVETSEQADSMRFALNEKLLESGALGMVSLKDHDNEVIQYDLARTIDDKGLSNAVLGTEAKLEYKLKQAESPNCNDAMARSRRIFTAIELQAAENEGDLNKP